MRVGMWCLPTLALVRGVWTRGVCGGRRACEEVTRGAQKKVWVDCVRLRAKVHAGAPTGEQRELGGGREVGVELLAADADANLHRA